MNHYRLYTKDVNSGCLIGNVLIYIGKGSFKPPLQTVRTVRNKFGQMDIIEKKQAKT